MTEPLITYLSYGGGIQSFTIGAMIGLGDLPPVDLAIHADTTHEMAGTYAHIAKWKPWLAEHGVNLVIVRGEQTDILYRNKTNRTGTLIPAFTKEQSTDDEGQVKRQCTSYWKVRPIRKHLRTFLPPNPPAGSVECWQGISLDEWTRMRDSDVKYIVNRYPLVEKRMTRKDCIQYLENHGLEVPPKSACTFCPYHGIEHWKNIKRAGGEDWDEIVEMDNAIRDQRKGFKLYVHPARIPVEEAIRIPEDYGARQLSLEDAPCDGGTCFS